MRDPQITCTARAEWMAAHGVQPAHIRDAALHATVVLEDREDDQSFLRPCGKCCSTKGLPIVQISGEMGELPAPAPGLRSFIFYRCIPHCNSSRLHLGGRVRVAFHVRDAAGGVVARALTPPLVLHSKVGRKQQQQQQSPPAGRSDDAEQPPKRRRTAQQASSPEAGPLEPAESAGCS
eukprot:m51a1_g10864 hypothetical protein (178) ;mRNA; r:32487-33323